MITDPDVALPLAFAGLMGISILAYVVLDGFDLGIGILLPFTADNAERDSMVASIGPFWDANETWLVMSVGLLLVAFPAAHGIILTALYLPVALMLLALIARGVAFEFRAKTPAGHRGWWDFAFFGGSIVAALSQGFMLGIYIMGLTYTFVSVAFAILTAICLVGGYAFIGAGWLLIKAEGDLQKRAAKWARASFWGLLGGLAAVSMASPLVSPRIFEKWFTLPEILYLAPLPLASAAVLVWLFVTLRSLPHADDRLSWVPFAGAVALFVLAFIGLAYSFYPYVVLDRLTIFQGATAPESLMIVLVGALFVIPMVVAYNVLSYVVFRGKATDLTYH